MDLVVDISNEINTVKQIVILGKKTDIPDTEATMKIFENYVGSSVMNESILLKPKTDLYSHSN